MKISLTTLFLFTIANLLCGSISYSKEARLVFFLFGGIQNAYVSNFDGLEKGLLSWMKLGYQPRAIFGATRKDLRSALRNSRTEFVFWVGHGDKSCTTDWEEARITKEDFAGLGPNVRGIALISCQQNAFYEKIKSYLRENELPIPSFWSFGDSDIVRTMDFSEITVLFREANIQTFFSESSRVDSVSCRQAL